MNQKQQHGGYANTDEHDRKRQQDQADGDARSPREATDESSSPPRPDDPAGRPGEAGSDTHPDRDAMERPL